MELNKLQMLMLKFSLNFTGETETNAKGEDVPSARRLDNDKSSQRRQFAKKVDAHLAEIDKDWVALQEKMKLWWKDGNPKKENEDEKVYEQRMVDGINSDEGFKKEAKEIHDRKYLVELEPKTKAVVKECFESFGQKGGWTSGDDEIVEQLTELLK